VQELAGLSFQMAAAVEQRPAEDDVRRVLSESAAGTRNAIRQLRSLLLEIYPPSLESQGLAAALPDLASSLTGRGINVHVQAPPDDGLSPETEQLVFRVAQEALRNVASHSAATNVRLIVEQDARSVRLEVSDDGRGFDPLALEQGRSNGHIGMALMRDLARAAGGTLDVESAPGEGTRLRLEVPAGRSASSSSMTTPWCETASCSCSLRRRRSTSSARQGTARRPSRPPSSIAPTSSSWTCRCPGLTAWRRPGV
jgi:two-component system NarL family sensor kinase